MNSTPKLSFIVLSYNYSDLIGQTIRSILDQTIQDFEIVVVDDASQDNSCAVVREFGDPRIRLLENARNIGGAASYNRAVQAATGEYLVNLDADDWIAPEKSARQLMFLQREKVDILGTYTSFVDRAGAPHPRDEELGAHVNQPHDLNTIDAWIGRNNLVRSSTMVDRAAHLRVGYDDPAMVRAPDYELWTRFLGAGCRFAVMPEVLTYYRVHGGGVTHADPRGSMLEMSYAMLRNLMPLIEARAAWPSLFRMFRFIVEHEALPALPSAERERLFGVLQTMQSPMDFAAFSRILTVDADDPTLRTTGRRLLALMVAGEAENRQTSQATLLARDYWHSQSDAWEAAMQATLLARDYWHSQSDAWEAAATHAARATSRREGLLWQTVRAARYLITRPR